jgi:hypothetical protein
VLADLVAGTTGERHHAALACMEHVFATVSTTAAAASVFGLKLSDPVSA